MAEYTNANTVTVAAGQNVPFTETAVVGSPCIVHREGAGIVTLRGLTNQCRARFKVTFGGNIAIPTGGAVGAISAVRQYLRGREYRRAARLLPHRRGREYERSGYQRRQRKPHCGARGVKGVRHEHKSTL